MYSLFQCHKWIAAEKYNAPAGFYTNDLFITQDYSDKYGFGYALCDESIGVVFNDLTKLLLLTDGM